MKFGIISILLFLGLSSAYGTHERAGEITYRHITRHTYEFTITTYTYAPSPADRPFLPVDWGDGTIDTVLRISKIGLTTDMQKNTYIAQHTFPAAGTYTKFYNNFLLTNNADNPPSLRKLRDFHYPR